MPSTRYSIRPYQDGDEHQLVELFNEIFGGAPGIRPRTLAHWRWLYQRNPAGRRIVVGEDDHGRLISHYAALPSRFQAGGRSMIAGQVVDTMVCADRRSGLQREGVFLRTARDFFRRYCDPTVHSCYFGFPNRRAYRIGRRFLRYEPFFDPIVVLFRNFFQDTDDEAVGCRFASALTVEEFSDFGAAADSFWSDVAAKYPFAIIRDRAYGEWRYDACPTTVYRRFRLVEGSGRLRGWMVLQERWLGQPILALVDLLVDPADEPAVAVAFRHATRIARETRHMRVEAWLPGGHPTFRFAQRAGFQTEPGPTVMALDVLGAAVTRASAREVCYFTIGDSDIS